MAKDKKPKKVRIEDDVIIALLDGTRLSARIWFPETDHPCPAILEYHPYAKRYATAKRDEIAHGFFARQGYVSIRVDMRGAGESEGVMSDEYTNQERADAVEVINWIASQDWCSGAVGMFGLSWGGFNSLQLAAIAPPPLKAVAVAGATDDQFREDAHFLGGVTASDHIGWSTALFSFLTRPPDPDMAGKQWKKLWKKRLDALEWMLPRWLSHPARDNYWTNGFPSASSDGIRVPALVAGGTADVFATSVLRMVERQPDMVKAVIGPWAHKFPNMGIPGPAIDWLAQCTRWYDRWLKEVENGAEKDPVYRSFVTDSYEPSEHSSASRKGRWISLNKPPARNQKALVLPLGRDASLGGPVATGKVFISTPQDLGMDGGEIMPMGWGADLPGDQRHDDSRSVCFDTEPLRNDRGVLGQPTLTLRLSCDKPHGFCVARLCDVAPDGKSTRISIGAVNLNLNDDMSKTVRLKPGVVRSVTLPINAVSHCFRKGHRIRIALSNTYWPMLFPSPQVNTLTLYLKGAALDLPLIPASAKPYSGFGSADPAVSLPRTELEPTSFERKIIRDVGQGATELFISDDAGLERAEESGLEHWGRTDRSYTIEDNRPDTATFRIDRSLGIQRAGFSAYSKVDAVIRATKTHYEWELEMIAKAGRSVVTKKKLKGRSRRKY